MKNDFQGFTKETVDFLYEIGFNNSKAWFEENRSRYKEKVLKPFQQLVVALSDFMLQIDPEFETRPEVDKTISRIYRDVRFSKDKSPYRNTVWITFHRYGSNWKVQPCFFFELMPPYYRYGMGYYDVERETMDHLRRIIDTQPDVFAEIDAVYRGQNRFVMDGDKYKKIMNPVRTPEELEWYQRKNIFFMCTKPIDDLLYSPMLLGEVEATFREMKPLYEFLRRL